MKKVIVTIMLAFFTLSFSSVFAAEYPVDEITRKTDILRGLDILEQAEYDEAQYLNYITKGEFITYICNMMGEYGDDTNEVLDAAEQLGIIKERSIELKEPLKYEQAVTMLVRALGYEEFAEARSGYPTGYVRCANELGLSDDVSLYGDERVKFYNAVRLLYNTLDISIASVVKVSVGEDDRAVEYTTENNETILSAHRKIHKIDGIVDAVGCISLRADGETDEGYFTVDGTRYRGIPSEELIGCYVEAYVKSVGKDEYELVYAAQDENNILTLDADDIASVAADFKSLTYVTDSGKKENVKISAISPVLFNQVAYANYTTEIFKPANGNVKLIDNNDDNIYDVVMITSYDTFIADSIIIHNDNLTNLYTYNPENISLSLEANNYDKIQILKNGNAVTLADIKKNNVLSVAKGSWGDKQIIRIYVSDEAYTGVVEKMVYSESEQRVTVNQRELVVSKAYTEALAKNDFAAIDISVGVQYKFYLDYNGDIAYVEPATGSGKTKYALVKDVTVEDDGLTSSCLIRVMTTEGNWEVLKLKETLRRNGESKVDDEKVLGELRLMLGSYPVIEYELDGNGEINNIELPYVSESYNKERLNAKQNLTYTYRAGNMGFGTKIYHRNPIVWCVDTSNPDQEEAYSVNGSSFFQYDMEYNFSVYKVDEYGFAELFVVMQNDKWKTLEHNGKYLYVVEDIGEGIAVDKTVKTKYTVATQSYSGIHCFSDDPEIIDTLKKGDVVSIITDDSGIIKGVEKYYSLSDGIKYQNADELHNTKTILSGIVLKRDGVDEFIQLDCGDNIWVLRTYAGIPVIIYDKALRENNVRIGSVDDITKDDFVVVKIRSSRIQSLVIVR